jgi:hypothetical protein
MLPPTIQPMRRSRSALTSFAWRTSPLRAPSIHTRPAARAITLRHEAPKRTALSPSPAMKPIVRRRSLGSSRQSRYVARRSAIVSGEESAKSSCSPTAIVSAIRVRRWRPRA